MKDKLETLINESDLNKLQKLQTIGLIDWANQERNKINEDRNLIEQVAYEKNLSEVILSTDSVKIYTVRPKSKDDEWAIKYPYRSIFVNSKGAWERSSTVSPSLDVAFLVYLDKKYLGDNSQFVDFVAKMLGLNLDQWN